MLAFSVLAFIGIIIADFLIPPPPQEVLRQLRAEMLALRATADSCQAALDVEEAELVASDARFDSLKFRIDYYEGLDARGVPADSYEAYLRIFNDYNQGIPAREAAGDTLQAHWELCRAIVARHNTIADSARVLAEELGLVRDPISDPAEPGN
jgi:hypothetical protein